MRRATSEYVCCALCMASTVTPPLRPAVPGQEGLLGVAEGLASWGPTCLVFLGTGGQISRMTGPGTGLGEARTVPTSQMMAAGMTTSAAGPTAGSARQSWAGPPRSLRSLNLFPRCLHLLKAPHFGILVSGASCTFLGLFIWAVGEGRGCWLRNAEDARKGGEIESYATLYGLQVIVNFFFFF